MWICKILSYFMILAVMIALWQHALLLVMQYTVCWRCNDIIIIVMSQKCHCIVMHTQSDYFTSASCPRSLLAETIMWEVCRVQYFCCCTVQECDARVVAEIEEEKLRDAEREKRRVEHERTEKAYLRHKHALEKELLKEVDCFAIALGRVTTGSCRNFLSCSKPSKLFENRIRSWEFWNLMSEVLASPWISVVQDHCYCDVVIFLYDARDI